MPDRVGQQLGNYRLIRLLGRGGFAEVYLGEHVRLNTLAAIKIMHANLSDSDAEGFLNEARTIARLEHPHIVRVLDFDVEGGTAFLVMYYAPNGNLRQRHPKGTRLPLHTIVNYVKQVADALQYAHNEKLIHRDIKPENMLLGRNDNILLSDFGLVLLAQTSSIQSLKAMAGTAYYMAPEQLQGKPRLASDQYALGVVVYEWLCGDRPFHGTFTEIYSQHMFVPPPSLRERLPEISSAVEAVVFTALAKDPARRFANVQAFANSLERAYQLTPGYEVTLPNSMMPPNQPRLATDEFTTISPSQSQQFADLHTPPSQLPGHTNVLTPPNSSSQLTDTAMQLYTPTTPSPPTSMPRVLKEPQPPKRRVSRRLILAGLVGLAATGSSLAWLALSQRSQPSSITSTPQATATSSANTPLPTNTTINTPPPATATSPVTVTPSTVISPSPTPTPTTSTAPTPPVPQGKLLFTYTGHSNLVNGVAWSPDGTRIASASFDHTVQVWDATSGANPLTYRGHSAQARSVAWSPDSTRIVSSSDDTTAQVWDASSGHPLYTYRGHSGGIFYVAWSLDGTRIASASGDHTVQVWEAASGAHLYTYTGHFDRVRILGWSPDGTRIASGSDDTTVQVWDAATGANAITYRGHVRPLNALAWSPDGTRIASGSWDATVQVWYAATANHIFTYTGHTLDIWAMAWSPNGTYIVSGGRDKTAQVWKATSGGQVFTYLGHHNVVTALAWSPDSKLIVSGGGDSTAQVWEPI